MCAMGNDLPAEAERLLSVAPDDFVAERKRLVGELRAAGRAEEAAVVASLRKPPPVVLAVNRAVRARPKIAKAAATAAGRVKKAQLNGDLGAYQSALVELEESLALLLDVALAHVAPAGKEPSEAIRHRLRELLRNAVADDEACEQLARGVLEREVETTGFSAFAGAVPARRKAKTPAPSPNARAAERRREREHELRAELAHAEARLRETERSLQDAEREHASAVRAVEAIRTRLGRATEGA